MNEMLRAAQMAAVGMGVSALLVNACLAARFMRSRRPIGRAVAVALAAEAISLAVVLVFSVTAFGVVHIMTAQWATMMRLLVFTASLCATMHLGLITLRIESAGPPPTMDCKGCAQHPEACRGCPLAPEDVDDD